ncbi:hypothetical protein IP87_18080 [beta proteobacterium AAP121]|nr:hypothetical protein IP87_18080 [beta proteobacterium AAP121]
MKDAFRGPARRPTAAASAAALLLCGPFAVWVPAAQAQTIDLGALKPDQCAGPYKHDDATKACVRDDDKMAQITLSSQCVGDGVAWKDGACSFVPDKAPKPTCGTAIPDLAVKDGKCVVQRSTPRSAPGQYVGDCFKVVAEPQPNDLGFSRGERLVVQSQTDEGDDKLLRVARAERASFGGLPIPYFCSATGPELKQVRASQLNAAGASRLGWTYGVLTMPFKYYRHDKSFSSGASIGPYVGRRSGAAGSAITFAVAATIGSVKGEVRDATTNTVTGTPELMAYSVAFGWMYDISKAPGVKPFKIGLFFGQDRVSGDKVANYKQNGRGWVAFQIGFDFTDN